MRHPRANHKSRQERRAARRKKNPPRALIIVRDQSSSKTRRFRYERRGIAYVVTWRDGRIERVVETPRNGAAHYKKLPGALVERVRHVIDSNETR